MKIEKFEDIIAWQKAKMLTINIYQTFEKSRDYWFKDQIQRARVSVMNNIAEWFERRTNKELRSFFYIAKWSCAEVRSMVYLALDLWYIDRNKSNEILNLLVEISKMLSGFIKTI